MDSPGIAPGSPRCKRGILLLDYEPMQTNSRPRTKVGFFFRKKETTMVEKTTIVSTTKSLAAGVSATFLEVLNPISYLHPRSTSRAMELARVNSRPPRETA